MLFILDCRWCGPAPIGLGVPSTGVQICMCLVLDGNRPPYWSATTPSSKTKYCTKDPKQDCLHNILRIKVIVTALLLILQRKLGGRSSIQDRKAVLSLSFYLWRIMYQKSVLHIKTQKQAQEGFVTVKELGNTLLWRTTNESVDFFCKILHFYMFYTAVELTDHHTHRPTDLIIVVIPRVSPVTLLLSLVLSLDCLHCYVCLHYCKSGIAVRIMLRVKHFYGLCTPNKLSNLPMAYLELNCVAWYPSHYCIFWKCIPDSLKEHGCVWEWCS